MREGGKKTEEERRIGGAMRSGTENQIRDANRKIVAAVKSGAWRKTADVRRPCASQRRRREIGHLQRDNARKIRLTPTEIVGLTGRRWQGHGLILLQIPSPLRHLPQYHIRPPW
jgi:hypothetical protein